MWLELLFFYLGLLKSVAGVSLDLAVVPAKGVSPLADDVWEGDFCDARCGFGDAALID